MKKVLTGLFAAFFASTVLFTAWPQSASMKNGTYTGTGEGKGGKITVQVTVKKDADGRRQHAHLGSRNGGSGQLAPKA